MMAANGDYMFSSVLQCGPATFMNKPWLSCDSEVLKENGVTAAVLGYPFDTTTIVRTGASMGPRRVREMSELYIDYHMDYDIDVSTVYKLADCGDIPVKPGDSRETIQRGKKFYLEILKAGALPIMIGGEHSGPIIPVEAFKEFTPDKKYGYIIFDSHLDSASDVDGDIYSHCCPVTRAVDTGIFPAENVVCIGPGGSCNPIPELNFYRNSAATLFTIRDVYRLGIEAVVRKALEIASRGTDGVYLTIDMDCLEACYTPGTCVPTPGGITAREMILALDILGEANLIGFDVCEIAPAYDHSDITAITAARFVADMLASRARYLKTK